MPPTQSKPEPSKIVDWRNLIIWVAIALLIRWQVVEPRWIPSGSMLPTLQLQDRILVEKLRPRIARMQNKALKIGTIVVFHPPSNLVSAGYDPSSALIKRIIGLPGDQIEIREGHLWRNGNLIKESWRDDPMNYEMNTFMVPAHQLWVLGDNRDNSLDSHLWGPLPEEEVIGTAIFRYWPLKRIGQIRFPAHEKIRNNDRTAIRSTS